jgi:hypothetical protein
MKWFVKKINVDAGYTDILKNNTGWFITLAGDSNQDELRDLIVHHLRAGPILPVGTRSRIRCSKTA